MQLYAIDEDKKISADSAEKGVDYICFECGGFVRVRGGFQRRTHFFHKKYNRRCRQSNKSRNHLFLQEKIYELLPENDGKMEMIFFDILRIGDVVWLSKKIVFEIQCSRITTGEISRRTKDYESLGYQVVWILDERIFNKKKVSDQEVFLRKQMCYFAKCFHGKAIIYDQYEHIKNHYRIYRGRNLILSIQAPEKMHRKIPKRSPFLVRKRMQNHPLFFKGDLVDLTIHSDPEKLYRFWEGTYTTSPLKKGILFLKNLYFEAIEAILIWEEF